MLHWLRSLSEFLFWKSACTISENECARHVWRCLCPCFVIGLRLMRLMPPTPLSISLSLSIYIYIYIYLIYIYICVWPPPHPLCRNSCNSTLVVMVYYLVGRFFRVIPQRADLPESEPESSSNLQLQIQHLCSLTRLCLEGFLLNILKGWWRGAPQPIPPTPAHRFPRPDFPDSPSLRSQSQGSQAKDPLQREL